MIWCKREWMLVAAALAALAFCTASANAELLGPNGIVAPTGINPTTGQEWKVGDIYHLAFVTSTKRNATASGIALYNQFVNAAADLSTLPGVADAAWYVIGTAGGGAATANVNALVSAPVYLLDGTSIVANNKADFWDGTLAHAINMDESGVTRAGVEVWTGSNNAGGWWSGGEALGYSNVWYGHTGYTNTWWFTRAKTSSNNTPRHFYALSEPLSIAIPEPGTLALLGVALLGLGWYAWRKRRR